jgi:hypothetical protein
MIDVLKLIACVLASLFKSRPAGTRVLGGLPHVYQRAERRILQRFCALQGETLVAD